MLVVFVVVVVVLIAIRFVVVLLGQREILQLHNCIVL